MKSLVRVRVLSWNGVEADISDLCPPHCLCPSFHNLMASLVPILTLVTVLSADLIAGWSLV